MNMQFYQLATLVSYALLAFGVYKVDKVWARALFIAIAAIVFFVNPVRFKQENISALERPINRFDDMPEKVVVDKPSFKERQNIEMNEFNSNYEESRDEIHN